MSRTRANPGFLEGVAVAALASLGGAATHVLLRLLLSATEARVATIALLGLCWLLYLLWRSPPAAGRVTLLLGGCTVTAGTLLFLPGWTLAVQLGLLWLARALLWQPGPLAALLDLGLVLLGLGGGLWAIQSTGSLAAAIWCFFLVQALAPTLAGLLRADAGPSSEAHQRFARAERTAQACLRRLASQREPG